MTEELGRSEAIQRSIVTDMSDGVLVLGLNGRIELINPAALKILGKKEEELKGEPLYRCFFDRAENDAFVQAILDSVYENDQRHVNVVPYYIGDQVKQLRLITSFQKEEGKKIGVIAVISDLTELTELQDAVKAMKQIQELNEQLEVRNQLLKTTFGRYLSDEIVKEILEKPKGLELGGEKRTVTILMSDLRGFTAMCERMDPQDLTASLNHYFSEMYQEISRYQGTIVEFLGDGLFIIFGAPVERGDHAADAVAAALGMQQRMPAVNAWNQEHGYDSLEMGIGINTGEVVLGNIGSEQRTKYGVMGANVNLTGRIESYTSDGQILISPSTKEAIRAELSVAHEFPVKPKGVRGEIILSEIVGIGAPYDRYLETQSVPQIPLTSPENIVYHLLEGKHLKKEALSGEVVSLSEKEAMLRTGEELEVFDNVVIQMGEELYAKVTGKKEGLFELTFTAKPKSFPAWFGSLTARRSK